MKSLIEIWSYRNLIWNLAQRELRARYKKSILGWLWSLINPAATLAIYTVVFGTIFAQPAPPSGSGHAQYYAMYLFAGLVVWNYFNSTVTGSIIALQGSGGLLNKVYFPPAAPAIANTFTTLLQLFIESAILVVVMAVMGNIGVTYLLFPLLAICLTFFSLGIGLFLSVYNVRYRDVNYLVTISMQVLFYATPVIYSMELVKKSAPEPIYNAIRLNPLTQFVGWSRDAFYTLVWPSWWSLLGVIGVSLITFALGWSIFVVKTRDIAEELVSKLAISVDDVSKRFRVYKERPDSLKERVTSFHRVRHEDFWALRNVSLEVPKGCVYGLVGHNGSGKSSLLRIMAGIHRPTTGTVTTDGRISALLELGAGFHPDLSGRENIFLNSAILGLSRKETERLYDQIVEFSGIGEFMDTPVKHYSSGMYVRLGFSVAVHVEPQILIIDEVIAVGDEEFQRRCFEHLNKLRRQGATIVMVTHGLNFVQSLCDEATWLDHGHVLGQGPAPQVVRKYMSLVNEQEVERLEHEVAAATDSTAEHEAEERRHGAIARLDGMEFLDDNEDPLSVATVFEPITFRLRFHASKPIRMPLFSFVLFTEGGQPIAHPGLRVRNADAPMIEGDGYVDFHVPRFTLASGLYTISIAMQDRPGGVVLDRKDEAYQLHVQPGQKVLWGMTDLAGEWGEIQATEVDESSLTE